MGQSATAEAVETLVSKERIADQWAEGGKFLPLSVWEHKGFDRQLIERGTLPEDIDMHPLFGATYRVRIRSKVCRLLNDDGWARELGPIP